MFFLNFKCPGCGSSIFQDQASDVEDCPFCNADISKARQDVISTTWEDAEMNLAEAETPEVAGESRYILSVLKTICTHPNMDKFPEPGDKCPDCRADAEQLTRFSWADVLSGEARKAFERAQINGGTPIRRSS